VSSVGIECRTGKLTRRSSGSKKPVTLVKFNLLASYALGAACSQLVNTNSLVGYTKFTGRL